MDEKILQPEQTEKYPFSVVDNETGVVTFLQGELEALEMLGNNHREMTMYNEEIPVMRTRILENGQMIFDAVEEAKVAPKGKREIVDWYESDGKMHTGYLIGISRDAVVVKTSGGQMKTIEGTSIRGGMAAFKALKSRTRGEGGGK